MWLHLHILVSIYCNTHRIGGIPLPRSLLAVSCQLVEPVCPFSFIRGEDRCTNHLRCSLRCCWPLRLRWAAARPWRPPRPRRGRRGSRGDRANRSSSVSSTTSVTRWAKKPSPRSSQISTPPIPASRPSTTRPATRTSRRRSWSRWPATTRRISSPIGLAPARSSSSTAAAWRPSTICGPPTSSTTSSRPASPTAPPPTTATST